MTLTALIHFGPSFRQRLLLGGVVLGCALLTLGLLASETRRQIDRQGANPHSAQWALSRIEPEVMDLGLAAEAARFHNGPLSEVRLRYDLVFSRLTILDKGGQFQGLRGTPEFVQAVQPVKRLAATYMPLIDGPDAALRQSLAALSADANAALPAARQIALAGVVYFTKDAAAQREHSERALQATLVLTALLITALIGLIVLLLRSNRDNRRQAAQNLQTLSRLDAIVSTAQEAIITLDDRGRIVDFNAAATGIFGCDRAEAVGADLAGLILDPALPQSIFQPGKAPRFWGGGPVRLTTRHKSGNSLPVELSVSQTQSAGAPLYVASLRDLSAQLASEQALVAARDKALAGEKAKSDLLVVMSHEIRTPLNGMIGTIDLLTATTLAPEQKEYLRILEASGQLLMHHVNDVLDIARLDNGKVTPAPGPVDLDALVQEVLENQCHAARLNSNVIHYVGPAEGGARVLVDGASLRQVLLNLVGNAVKFTHSGRIEVRIHHHTATGPTEISVSDTGIGIPAADLDRVFEDFVTLDATYARMASGTGLGLGIVRRIVDRMGGTLGVSSTPGAGSLFRVTLPLPILTEATIPPATLAQAMLPPPVMTTLVIDDNEFNRMIVHEMLRQDGHTVIEARDGLEGIALAAAQRFDVILMDISMPGMDGVQAARAIATGPGLSRSTPILAMTAHALAADTVRFTAAGMRDALIKPITRHALQRALGSIQPAPALLDMSVLAEMQADLGPARAHDLVARFLAETSQSVTNLINTITLDQTDIAEVHRLEGSAAMFGANALRLALSQIQTLWKSGTPQQACSGLPGLQPLWQLTHQAYRDTGFLAQPSSLR